MKNHYIILLLTLAGSSLWAQTENSVPDYDRTIAPYFVAEFSPLANDSIQGAQRMAIQQEHLAYIKALAEQHKLALAGPFKGGGGLFFLKAKDMEEAVALINADPSVKAGLESYTLRLWFTEKGLFTLENEATSKS
ncbi:MAG: YciI family protein [Owenweeksia sp.]|nr:YciI family protein [Owenweeksia sp.]